MAEGAPKPSNDEYSSALTGLRQQAEAHGLDPNDEKVHNFILHEAEVKAQDTATVRWLYNILDPAKDHAYNSKGTTIPQTIENLQRIMACDAVTIWELDKQLTQANCTIQSLQRRLLKRKKDTYLNRG